MELQSNLAKTLSLPPIDPLIGRVLDSKYTILACIGRGGIGAVYRARRAHILDEVAIKVLYRKYVTNPVMIERFRREARAAAQISDQHVVHIYDYNEDDEDGIVYFVMKYIPGSTLRTVLQREGHIAPKRAVKLMMNICCGVGAAHHEGIVHRDLKPDNIMYMMLKDKRERLIVIDFGFCKMPPLMAEMTLTQPGVLIGTPCYMSPEQCRGESLDVRADVYSLGVMLYEMIAGQPPFLGPSVMDVIVKHLTEEPTPLPAQLGVSSELNAVIIRALAKNPQERQANAMEFASELQRCMQPVSSYQKLKVPLRRPWWETVMYRLGLITYK